MGIFPSLCRNSKFVAMPVDRCSRVPNGELSSKSVPKHEIGSLVIGIVTPPRSSSFGSWLDLEQTHLSTNSLLTVSGFAR